jgi:hypothetical protein
VAICEKTFTSRLIRNFFKERGIFPPDGSSIIEAIQNTLPPVIEISAPDLHVYGETTPPPNPLSSSVENTPPKSAQQVEKNQKKLFKLLDSTTDISLYLERYLDHLFHQ